MRIEEAEEILGCFHALRAPKHLIIFNEPVHEVVDGIAYYRGLQPKHRSDTIALTPQKTDETFAHELVHADLGLGELAAYPMGKVLIWKYRVLRNLPTVKSLIAPPMKYHKCPSCEEFPELHQKYAGRAEHFIRA